MVKKTILYKRTVLKFIQFQDNIHSTIKCVIILGYATMSNDELLSSLQGSLLPPSSWYKQSQGSDCENFQLSKCCLVYIYIYIYICIEIFLCVLKSTEFIFTINIGATCIGGFVTIDNINRSHTAATRGAMHSITESLIFRW